MRARREALFLRICSKTFPRFGGTGSVSMNRKLLGNPKGYDTREYHLQIVSLIF